MSIRTFIWFHLFIDIFYRVTHLELCCQIHLFHHLIVEMISPIIPAFSVFAHFQKNKRADVSVILSAWRRSLPVCSLTSVPPLCVSVGKDEVRGQLDSALQDVNVRYAVLEETEKRAVCRALIEERARYCSFVTMLKPVLVSAACVCVWDDWFKSTSTRRADFEAY